MNTTFKRLTGLLLSFAMVLGLLPATGYADGAELPVPVTTEGNTYSLFTGENLENQFGNTFLYVVERGGRYYTPAHPGSTGSYAALDSVAAIDITAYWDPETNTFSGIPDSANVGVMQYQSYTLPEYSTSGLFLDGNIMLSLSVPFDDSGETWFDGGICYYSSDNTYSYSRALWEATGDGSGYFYESYYDWFGDKHEVHGVLALKGDDRFALLNCSEELAAEQPVNVNGYLYAAPCDHAILDYSAYVAPTCMDKGCKEYWYCIYCDTSFKDADCTSAYECRPVLPALDHDYGATGCVRCGKPVPVYTRITSYEQFKTVDLDASFIAVAELDNGSGGKDYYVLKKEIATTMADIDEDGQPDVLLVDDNGNGTADILETDANGDGVADAMAYDGIYDGEPDGLLDDDEIWEYLFYLEREYTDGYIPSLHTMTAIPVTPAADGTISVQGLEALEWIMERKYPDAVLEDQYYGDGATVKDYENDFRFRIPNYWIRSVVTIDNNFYQQPYDQGDSKWWGVLFGKDGKAMDSYLYEELYGADYPDDAAILYTEAFYSLNTDGQLEHALRFLVNGEKKNFIMTSDSFWEELEGTQYPIYLYCSDAGDEVHEHVFGAWTSVSEENHKRTCTVAGCTAYELASHGADENAERTPDADNYQLGHWVTCTECSGQYHEYHTREEAGRYYPSYWRDTGDGIHHVVYCTVCLGPVEYAEHDWSDWYNGNQEINGEWVRGHYRRCEDFPCEANEWRAECIYDEGVVTTEPTCTEPGIRTYTCTADPACELETKTYTEEIPALDHDWGDWTLLDSDPTREQRICKRDPNHTEERDAAVHEHNWGAWMPDGDENHTRTCSAEGCTARTETEAHDWDNGVITTQPTCTAEGTKTYTCGTCGHTKTEAVAADPTRHDFGGWSSIGDAQHSRSCRNEGCTATETEDHTGESTVIQIEDCETEGQEHYYCETCGYENYATRPARGHDWGAWEEVTPATEGVEGLEKRICAHDSSHVEERAIPALSHSHSMRYTEAKAPSCLDEGHVAYYLCVSCQHYYSDEAGTNQLDEIAIPALDHDWSDWTDTGAQAPADVHQRSCSRDGCDASEFENHTWSEWSNAGAEHSKTCAVCFGQRTASHTFGEWEVQPDGSLKRICSAVACDAAETMAGDGVTDATDPSGNAAEARFDMTVEGLVNSVLDEQAFQSIEQGAAVSIYLVVEDITASVSEDDQSAAAAAAGSSQIGMYLDIDLFCAIDDDEQQVTETDGKIRITLQIPDELINTNAATTRTYKIVRVHNGVAETIEGYFDPEARTFTFETDKFSTYALTYTDHSGGISLPLTHMIDVAEARNGTVRTSPISASEGAAVTIIVKPDTGYVLETLTVADKDGTELAISCKAEGRYTFQMPDSKVTVQATFMDDNTMLNYFVDVAADAYYRDAVLWAVQTGITNGTSIATFSPNEACTRAQMATFLWRAAGSPDPVSKTCLFTDVPADAYYAKAVQWAYEQGITSGTSATTFSPDDPCSRAQMAVFLCRMADGKAVSAAEIFTDVAADAYYAAAIQWAYEQGITSGTSATTFSPDDPCTRGQMVTFLHRYFVK